MQHIVATSVLFGHDFPKVVLFLVIVGFIAGVCAGIHQIVKQNEAAKAEREEKEGASEDGN